MITLEEVIAIHQLAILRFGGAAGIRDQDLLLSAIARPFGTFDGIELYPTSVDKSAAIIESIVKNHPFSDGNKRTGYILMRLLLMKNGFDIKATTDEKYKFVIQIAEGKIDFEKIKTWINGRIIEK